MPRIRLSISLQDTERSPNTNRLRPKGYKATRTGHTGGICIQPQRKGGEAGTGSAL